MKNHYDYEALYDRSKPQSDSFYKLEIENFSEGIDNTEKSSPYILSSSKEEFHRLCFRNNFYIASEFLCT